MNNNPNIPYNYNHNENTRKLIFNYINKIKYEGENIITIGPVECFNSNKRIELYEIIIDDSSYM